MKKSEICTRAAENISCSAYGIGMCVALCMMQVGTAVTESILRDVRAMMCPTVDEFPEVHYSDGDCHPYWMGPRDDPKCKEHRIIALCMAAAMYESVGE